MTEVIIDKEERENPQPSKCLGIFNLSLETNEKDLHDMFFRFGPIEDVTLVTDKVTKRSRGFGFVYFKNVDDAEIAKEKVHKMIVHGKELRVDFSVTQRPHTPTPGVYLGKKPYDSRRLRGGRSSRSGADREGRDRSEGRTDSDRFRDGNDRRESRYTESRRPRDWTDYNPRRRESPYGRPRY